jgi:hypothetical protein
MVFYTVLKWNSSNGLYIMGHLWFIRKQAYLNGYTRHEVLHMEWSPLKSLLWNQCWWRCFHFMEFNVGLLFIQIMVWLRLACEVKIARKWLRRTKRRWRASNGLGIEWPWLWWRRKYLHLVMSLIKLKEVILWGESNHCWIIWRKWLDVIELILINGIGSSHMLKMAVPKQKWRWTCWHPLLMIIARYGNVRWRLTQEVWIQFYLNLSL